MPTVGESEEWTVYWMDTSVLVERAMDMKRYQVSGRPLILETKYTSYLSSAEDQPLSRDG